MANYNNGKYIQKAIESVINQTFYDWELLIMDDGSKDDSIARINEYLEDDRITLFKNSVNRGKVPSLIELVDNSEADIFGILDSDDTLSKDAVSIMYEQHIKYIDRGFIHSQFMFCDNNLNPICEGFCRPIPSGETNLRSIYSSAFRTFKKDYYRMTEGYNEKFIYGQDRDIVFKMEEVTNLLFVNKVLYKHRILSDGISNNPKKRLLCHLLLIEAKYDAYCRRKGTKTSNLSNIEMSIELFIASIINLRLNRKKDFFYYIKLSLNLNPFLFLNIMHYLIKKIFQRVKNLLIKNSSGHQFISTKVDEEIRKQLRSI